jgi:folate-binding protein YgfZ
LLNCYYAKLEQETLLHIEGPDALTFLQGQVTCDTRELTASKALPGLYCTVAGRVVCDFLLCTPAQDHLMLRMRQDIRCATATLFAKYIVFSKATLGAERDDWQVSACWGPESAAALEKVFGALPRERYATCSGDGFLLVQMDAAGQQFECYLDRSATELESRLRECSLAASEADWQAEQIAGGIARLEAGTTGEYVPQLLNYDLTGHISFTKGCYTGQEVVARLHYRGTPKRRLYLADIEPDQIPSGFVIQAGDSLYGEDNPRAIGNVINRSTGKNGELRMLVTATQAGVKTGLRLAENKGPRLRTHAMPYPVPQ